MFINIFNVVLYIHIFFIISLIDVLYINFAFGVTFASPEKDCLINFIINYFE